MRVTIERSVTHLCPHVDERDHGTIRASWDGDAVELHALAAHLDSLLPATISHEALTQNVADYISGAGGIAVTVESQWVTAGLNVKVMA